MLFVSVLVTVRQEQTKATQSWLYCLACKIQNIILSCDRMRNLFYLFFYSYYFPKAPCKYWQHIMPQVFPPPDMSKMATHFKERLAQFQTSHLSWVKSQLRVTNVGFYLPTAYEHDFFFWNIRWASSSWLGFCKNKKEVWTDQTDE